MRIGSLRAVPTDMLTDVNHIRRVISRSRAARVYRDHPVGRRIAYAVAAASIVVAFLVVVGIPNGSLLLGEYHMGH